MPRGRPPGVGIHPLSDKPKGKMTPYAFFVQTCREEHKRKFPDDVVGFAEFSRKCADRWKTMSEKEKRRFNQMAEEDKKRYELEMANYVPKDQRMAAAMAETAGGKRRRKKKVKDPDAPKRCMSAFFWFSQDERPKVKAANPDFGVADIAKELSRRWSQASESVREKFDKLAEKDRERYDKDKKAYQARLRERNGTGPPPAAPSASSSSQATFNAPSGPLPDEEEGGEDELEEEEEDSE